MSVKFVAFALVAATGAMLVVSQPAISAGGARFAPAARIMVPAARPHPRAGLLRPSLRSEFAHSPAARAFRDARQGAHIPLSARGFGTTTPARPFATITPTRPFATTTRRPFDRLVRRHHRLYHNGWSFPVTVDGYDSPGYIGTPYDPAEAFPVYGPAPDDDESVGPPPAPITSRAANASPGEACRSEQVTVPASDGERTIKVVRC